jgi:hypothetical protein
MSRKVDALIVIGLSMEWECNANPSKTFVRPSYLKKEKSIIIYLIRRRLFDPLNKGRTGHEENSIRNNVGLCT